MKRSNGQYAPGNISRLIAFVFLLAGGLGLATLGLASLHGGDASLPRADNLQVEARKAQSQQEVLVLVFTHKDCPYCMRVKNTYLIPLMQEKGRAQRVRIVEIDQESHKSIRDFDGRFTTEYEFADANGVKLVPTVAFSDAQGNALSKPIVGALLDDFYQYYLEAGIKESACKLRYQAC